MQEHLYALTDILNDKLINKNKAFIHAFTDGRDCAPDSGAGYLSELQSHIKDQNESRHRVCTP